MLRKSKSPLPVTLWVGLTLLSICWPNCSGNLYAQETVVALGGGGRLGSREPGAASWFVAAGDRDFGKPGARNLANELTAKGKTVQWKEFHKSNTW